MESKTDRLAAKTDALESDTRTLESDTETLKSDADPSAVAEVLIRPYHAEDSSALRAILIEAFEGVCIDEAIESHLGLIAGSDWRWRKERDLQVDLERKHSDVFVAVIGDVPVGVITTWQDVEAGIGHIPNLAVAAGYRGVGIGRKLIQAAVDYFRRVGLDVAKIETLEQNGRANGLYTSRGFVEVARQRHLVMDLRNSSKSNGETSASH